MTNLPNCPNNQEVSCPLIQNNNDGSCRECACNMPVAKQRTVEERISSLEEQLKDVIKYLEKPLFKRSY